MKLKQKKSHKKLAIILSIIIVLAAGGSAVAYQVVQKNNDSETSKSSHKKKNSKKSTTENLTNDSSKTPTDESNKSTTNTDPQAPTTTNPGNSKTVVSVVTSANVSDGVVYIRGGINNVVDADGSCYAQLKGPSGQSIRKNTTLLQNASTSDCKTIQIPTSELSSGTWTYTLNYSSSNQEGISSENSFSL